LARDSGYLIILHPPDQLKSLADKAFHNVDHLLGRQGGISVFIDFAETVTFPHESFNMELESIVPPAPRLKKLENYEYDVDVKYDIHT
jgi:hypothetical protein